MKEATMLSTGRRRTWVGLLPFIILLLLASGCADKRLYKATKTGNTVLHYEEFLKSYPRSRYAPEARVTLARMKEVEAWERAKRWDTMMDYDRFLSNFPNSEHVPEARRRVQELVVLNAWNDANQAGTERAYQEFLDRYGNSKYADQARLTIDAIHREKRKAVEDSLYRVEHERRWNEARVTDLASTYERFITTYPKSQYRSQAEDRLAQLLDNDPDWKRAKERNTIQAYREYLRLYSNRPQAEWARSRMAELDELAWEKARDAGTVKAYKDYRMLYPDGVHVVDVDEYINELLWDKAVLANSVAAYSTYLKEFPNGVNAERARKKIIDLEVEEIFRGDHGELPPMSRSSVTGSAASTVSTVGIFNNTTYELTIRYSGVESKKIVIAPKQRTKVVLPMGSYKITASVKASNVSNYAGSEFLVGGEYESEYYIVTEQYPGQRYNMPAKRTW
jgi:outer membrane protein assembly factor BamD (BamD/ComL family)